jgi:hypothetical protein
MLRRLTRLLASRRPPRSISSNNERVTPMLQIQEGGSKELMPTLTESQTKLMTEWVAVSLNTDVTTQLVVRPIVSDPPDRQERLRVVNNDVDRLLEIGILENYTDKVAEETRQALLNALGIRGYRIVLINREAQLLFNECCEQHKPAII